MRTREHWKPPPPPSSSVSSSDNLLPHEEPEVSSAVVHTCATWRTFFWACQLSDAPDDQSDNRGTLRKRRKLKAAEFAEGIMASLSRDQDETSGLKQQNVCNFFIKKGCKMEQPKCICNRMTQVEGQAIGLPHTLPEETTPGIQNKEEPSSSKCDVEDNEERKKRRRTSD